MSQIMKCGCAANCTFVTPQSQKDGCGVHQCTEPAPIQPNLEGRTAVCSYGGNERASRADLALFKYRPDKKHDEYYCGCFGWD
jgi:hypothetical protein